MDASISQGKSGHSPQWFSPFASQQDVTPHSPPQKGFSMVTHPVQRTASFLSHLLQQTDTSFPHHASVSEGISAGLVRRLQTMGTLPYNFPYSICILNFPVLSSHLILLIRVLLTCLMNLSSITAPHLHSHSASAKFRHVSIYALLPPVLSLTTTI